MCVTSVLAFVLYIGIVLYFYSLGTALAPNLVLSLFLALALSTLSSCAPFNIPRDLGIAITPFLFRYRVLLRLLLLLYLLLLLLLRLLPHLLLVKVFEMDAEVEEMTRDRRNNILIHGLPVQEGLPNETPISTSQIDKFPNFTRSVSFLVARRVHGVSGEHHGGHREDEAGSSQGDHARQHLQAHAHQV